MKTWTMIAALIVCGGSSACHPCDDDEAACSQQVETDDHKALWDTCGGLGQPCCEHDTCAEQLMCGSRTKICKLICDDDSQDPQNKKE